MGEVSEYALKDGEQSDLIVGPGCVVSTIDAVPIVHVEIDGSNRSDQYSTQEAPAFARTIAAFGSTTINCHQTEDGTNNHNLATSGPCQLVITDESPEQQYAQPREAGAARMKKSRSSLIMRVVIVVVLLCFVTLISVTSVVLVQNKNEESEENETSGNDSSNVPTTDDNSNEAPCLQERSQLTDCLNQENVPENSIRDCYDCVENSSPTFEEVELCVSTSFFDKDEVCDNMGLCASAFCGSQCLLSIIVYNNCLTEEKQQLLAATEEVTVDASTIDCQIDCISEQDDDDNVKLTLEPTATTINTITIAPTPV